MPDSVRVEWTNVLFALDGASSALQTSGQHRTRLVRVKNMLLFLVKGMCLLKFIAIVDSITHLYLFRSV
jgi:hypothetical protein